MDAYTAFLKAKVTLATETGFPCEPHEVNPMLKPHQVASVCWAVRGGCRGLFKAFGLGKTFDQLEIVRITRSKAGGMGLIVIPLGVRQEFLRDAAKLGITVKFIRRIEECTDPDGIYLTNYETIRDGKLDPTLFTVASLDEASCLRGFGGTKTFREFMALFAGDRKTMVARTRSAGVRYRFVATATPSPNEYIELLAYAAFLGIMDVGQAKTRFFKRNSEKADQLTIHPHKEREFWLWCASWALFVQRPSDLGFSDEGYELPALDVRWHEIAADHDEAGHEVYGQARMFKAEAIGIIEASREKRDSLSARVAKMMEIRAEDPGAHRILWHDLEAERHAIERAIPSSVSVYGSQDLDEREQAIVDFSDGKFQELAAKPVIAGSGCNFQRHCAWAIFLGIGFKFNDFIQAIHRIQRFLQTKPVRIDLIYTEAERQVRRDLERKWSQHIEMVEKMSEIIREYGLSQLGMAESLTRALGVERVEVKGQGFTCVNDDCVKETARMASDSVGLVLTSIPFSTQYEYSPNYADFGHTDNNAHFFEQMDFLVPELLRVLQPGRIAAIHVKDRIVPGSMTGLGFQTVYPFHLDTIQCFRKHGFGYMGMKTIVTDVVRENSQTYRLGWSEQCKDGSKMGVGMPEYLLIFRKPPTSTEKSYADQPVVKSKPFSLDAEGNQVPFDKKLQMVAGTGYSRARWQLDAHGFTRSSGNTLIEPAHLENLSHSAIFKLFKKFSLEQVYDFEHHVRVGEHLEVRSRLPVDFMLLQPQSWSPEVWSDITRMLTLNGAQSAKGREMHLCPMQFDIADRAINQWSMPGEVVYDPFGGLMTVPYRAIKAGRVGYGCELSTKYFLDGVSYCEAAAREMAMPDLFAALEAEDTAEAA
ncbi:DNA methylase N-4 [Rhodoferax koreense]|uniref:DNA methylase N-4 n=1 Tax=Rhodoferax koreensis TaxID=1842727 RepID=A0A1P8JXI6_9BURK|nr:DNA methyltransferase [Rhodoferax koreense]APW38472.1 DNA methylase N-4 [Rhodoferax koreense]